MSALPIEDYALIGDSRSAALVSRFGSIDWLCWPRFDSPSLFARLLDEEKGGHFAIHPAARFEATRRYIDDTNVLKTTFTCEGGVAHLVDLMPVMPEEEKRRRLTPFRQILRRVEAVEGEIPFEVSFAPRPDYARSTPKLRHYDDDVISCEDGPRVLHLRSNVPLHIDGATATARFTLRAGEQHDFALGFDDHTPAIRPHIGAEADEEIAATLAFWRNWSSQLTYDGPSRDHIMRSALVLKLLTYAPSGGIIAAPTTSLPEHLGGVRNWDYRYCWLRDSSWTVSALYDCGFRKEAAAFLDWLLYSTKLTQPSLQVLYDVRGEASLPESTLDHLAGYAGSRPVRIGNDAHNQFQLDVYGEVLSAVDMATREGERLAGDDRRLMRKLAETIVDRWQEPDSGIWEKRASMQQHVHGKVLAWAGLDCAINLAERGHINDGVSTWRDTAEAIQREVLTKGFDKDRNTFVSILGSKELDSSLLFMPRVDFIKGNDPRMTGTIDAIRAALGHGELLYRYEMTTDDGLPPGEGAFVACSFWLVEALTLAGRIDEAHDVFAKLIARANDVGLFSEEIDVASGAFRGNFPQGLTHISLLHAAIRLSAARTSPQGSSRRERDR